MPAATIPAITAGNVTPPAPADVARAPGGGPQALDRATRAHLDDQDALVIPNLYFLVWGRKQATSTEPVKLNETSGCWSYLCILQGLDGWPGLVDPYLGGQGRSERASSAEPFGAGGEGVVEDLLAAGLDRPRGAVVDGGGCMKADAGMAVLGVIESEEGAAESSCVFQGLEAAGECRAVLEGLELRFAVGVVVGDVRPGMGFLDPQVGQELGDGLGGHRGAVVRVDVRGFRSAVSDDRVLDERSREVAVLPVVDFPVDGLAGEDVEHHVQVEVGAFPWSFQFRDVPGPDLVRAVSD